MQIIALWPLMICDVDAKANCCQMFSDSVLWTAVTDVSRMDNRSQHHGRADQDQNVVATKSSCSPQVHPSDNRMLVFVVTATLLGDRWAAQC